MTIPTCTIPNCSDCEKQRLHGIIAAQSTQILNLTELLLKTQEELRLTAEKAHNLAVKNIDAEKKNKDLLKTWIGDTQLSNKRIATLQLENQQLKKRQRREEPSRTSSSDESWVEDDQLKQLNPKVYHRMKLRERIESAQTEALSRASSSSLPQFSRSISPGTHSSLAAPIAIPAVHPDSRFDSPTLNK